MGIVEWSIPTMPVMLDARDVPLGLRVAGAALIPGMLEWSIPVIALPERAAPAVRLVEGAVAMPGMFE